MKRLAVWPKEVTKYNLSTILGMNMPSGMRKKVLKVITKTPRIRRLSDPKEQYEEALKLLRKGFDLTIQEKRRNHSLDAERRSEHRDQTQAN